MEYQKIKRSALFRPLYYFYMYNYTFKTIFVEEAIVIERRVFISPFLATFAVYESISK